MGIVFGVIDVERAGRSLLEQRDGYATYQQHECIVAEVKSSDENNGFRVLAKYIGVFGTPNNEGTKALAMTAPVISRPEQIRMTAPVVTQEQAGTMAFVMPKEYTMQTIPKPTDPAITLREIPAKKAAVLTFSWNMGQGDGERRLDELLELLRRDGVSWKQDDRGEAVWEVARYNPPFTVPFLKTNELCVEITA